MTPKPPHGANPPSAGFVDFSSNLHPAPPPAEILSAAAAGLSESTRYPEPRAETIRAAYSDRLNLPPEQILAGPGSSSLLYHILFALRPEIVVLPTPCFSEYPFAAARAGARVILHAAEAPAKLPPHACVILSNPCNPTGKVLPEETLAAWLREARDAEGFLIMDEAYADFSDAGPREWPAKEFDTYPLIILRSPLKFYSLPGIRAGIALMPADIADRVESDLPPWPLSQAAGAAVKAALEMAPEKVRDRRRRIRVWADSFRKAFRTLPRVAPVESDIHFFLIRLPAEGPDGPEVSRRLADHHLWIRTHAGMPGLTRHDIRVSTRLPEENGRLIGAMKTILQERPDGALRGL
ncbi:MAG: hypothetical protein A3G34_09635 [Candidatus Lindowbacteria bacterium RIFCSPLOWO2_12_FULL_62_27]|nr:MAG: hypothetical protein A3G34_09635 [Candidatus Lindowbacteria bacterium RIFCSPLOWO2_12_FULL_62_27]OGH61507.1 MAG: hypothetical protein A3I06_02635 [Candidatus Lindowbacteria bacterium RIFCSPLOWO2_02_FULL_62_12]